MQWLYSPTTGMGPTVHSTSACASPAHNLVVRLARAAGLALFTTLFCSQNTVGLCTLNQVDP
jgi:hypothetical protein